LQLDKEIETIMIPRKVIITDFHSFAFTFHNTGKNNQATRSLYKARLSKNFEFSIMSRRAVLPDPKSGVEKDVLPV